MVKLITDQSYLSTLLSLLEQAKSSIDIISYSFAIGSAGGRHSQKGAPYLIAQKLIELKEKYGDKIRIRLFTEGVRETYERNRVTAQFLKKASVEIVYGSTHAKGLCVDQEVVLFGSTNLTQQSITKNFEANLLIKDKIFARGFNKYFTHLWNGGEHGEIKLCSPFLADGDFKDVIIKMIKSAKRSIHFSIYFFNHKEIEESLIQAHLRGVKIRGFIHQHQSFAMSYIWANKSTVKRLRIKGIEDLHFGPPYTFSHSKYIVVDGKEFALGTGNWLVEDVEIHPQLYFHLVDPKISKELIKHLNACIKKSSAQFLGHLQTRSL